MKSNYKTIGDIVERIDIRNTNNSVDLLLGVSINKCFIHSVANTIGTDLSKYKIIHKDDFAVSLMQVSRDAKIPIACLKDYEIAIMSPAYSIFRVKNTKEILPDYLAMWFMRSEFDREAAFIAVGGVRGSMPWEEFCRIKVFVPTYEDQLNIVGNYKVITDRIVLKQQINDNLESSIECTYSNMFLFREDNNCFTSGLIGDVLTLQRGHDLPKTSMVYGIYPVAGSTGTISYHNEFTTEPPVIVMGRSGNIGNPRLYNCKCWAHNTTLYVKEYKGCNPVWAFYMLKHINYDKFVGGSAVPTLNRNFVHSYPITIPPLLLQTEFADRATVAINLIEENNREIETLSELQNVLLSTISSR